MLPLLLLAAQAQTVPLTPFVDDGGQKTRGSDPIILPLKKAGVRQTATVEAAGERFQVWIENTKGPAKALVVDLNRNGKPEPKEQVPTKVEKSKLPDGKEIAIYTAPFSLPLQGGVKAKYTARFFVFDSKDKQLDSVRDKLMLIVEHGYLGQAKFGGKTYKIGIRGSDPRSATLFIDRDGNGHLGSSTSESYSLLEPFNIGGTTYRMTSIAAGSEPSVTFGLATKSVEEVPLPPDLSVGKIAPPLKGKTLDGTDVVFPTSYPGKIVLLDVWATWCGPCIGEIPHMKAAYAKYKDQGLEIVSISIDDPNMRDEVAKFTKEKGTNWVQVYEGQGWKGPTCKRYDINGIPFMLLVDGTTGEILATETNLRGDKLDPTISAVLAKRGK
ncbi:MAG: redoxin domain-containing protein [Fimbriimonas sp.]